MFESKDLEQHKGKYYGLYRGYVYDNKDPECMGRIKVCIPSILGINNETGQPMISTWALPKFPIAGNGWGLNLIPPLRNKDNTPVMVWVEFEQGDIEYPVWSGCPIPRNGLQSDTLSNQKQTNSGKSLDTTFTLSTPKGLKIVLDDNSESIRLEVGKNSISIDKFGINLIGDVGNVISSGTFDVKNAKVVKGDINSITTSSVNTSSLSANSIDTDTLNASSVKTDSLDTSSCTYK